MSESRPLLARSWLIGWMALSSAWILIAARYQGATADDAPYIQRGLERWGTGSYKAFWGLGTMPLAADAQTLPLYLLERRRGRPFDSLNDMDYLLPRARAATLLFWWVFLLYGWLAARRLAGPLGGWV